MNIKMQNPTGRGRGFAAQYLGTIGTDTQEIPSGHCAVNPPTQLWAHVFGLARTFMDGEDSKMVAGAADDFSQAARAICIAHGWSATELTRKQQEAFLRLMATLWECHQVHRALTGVHHA
jgi:hypothetical protein